MAATDILTVPGLCCSGPDHWQSRWESTRADCSRIELPDWDDPEPAAWVEAIGAAIATRGHAGRIVLVAHSLGCFAVVGWALAYRWTAKRAIAGALLVAPPDVEADGADPRVARFAPVPTGELPFAAKLIASRDDPYASFDRLRVLADGWAADLIDVGHCGHINAQSGLGVWEEGQRLLTDFRA